MNYGKEIKALRARTKITQEKLAEKAGLTRTNLNNIENGRRVLSEKAFVRVLESMGYTLSKKIVKNNRNKA